MDLTILGFNSAIPTIKSNPTSQLLHTMGEYFLIDCGEGSQVQLRKAKAKFTNINHIFISHLHGDHVFGLIGLLSSFQLLGRKDTIYIYGPIGIKKFIETQLNLTESYNSFTIKFIELGSDKSELIFENNKLEVFTIPLEHRIYANGFLFKEKPKKRKLNIQEITKYPEIQICDYNNLKSGKDFISETGKIIKNEKLTYSPSHSYSYAFCSDTIYKKDIIPIIQGVDVLYHEATFLHDKLDLAEKTKHSTAIQAAKIAKAANAKYLILGHFSNRYEDVSVFREEAQQIFKNVIIPTELGNIQFEDLDIFKINNKIL